MNLLNSLDNKEWLSLSAIAVNKSLKKDEIIFSKGSRNNKEVFLESGVVRGFMIDEGGNEKSTAFFQAGEFMSTQTLRTRNGISIYSYQALCPTTLWLFDSKQLKQLLSENKKLAVLGREIKERELSRLSNRDECLIQVKAADRYQKFVQFYPDLERYIAQRHIASYLGITPVSLSRLKRSSIV